MRRLMEYSQLRQDSRQDGRNPKLRMQQPRQQSRSHTHYGGRRQRRYRVNPRQQQNRIDGGAGTQAAVHRQIGIIQNAVGHCDAQRHNAP